MILIFLNYDSYRELKQEIPNIKFCMLLHVFSIYIKGRCVFLLILLMKSFSILAKRFLANICFAT